MLTAKENYLIAARGGRPEWVPSFIDDANVFATSIWRPDPATNIDACNVKWIQDESGAMPDPHWKAMEDITCWREAVKLPVISDLDWEEITAEFHGQNYDNDKVDIAIANTHGIFLIPVNMLGWENGLCSVYENPEEYQALIDYLTDYICELIGYIGKYIKPDIIFSGDDIAGNDGPFISPELWRSTYRKNFTRICDAIHEQGTLAEFHCCGNNGYLVEEIIGAGYDICQLPVPNEGLIADKRRFGKRLVITGGWDRQGEAAMPGASEECVRASVREAIDTFGVDGGLIFWEGGIIGNSEDSKKKKKWIMDELHTYGRVIYKS